MYPFFMLLLVLLRQQCMRFAFSSFYYPPPPGGSFFSLKVCSTCIVFEISVSFVEINWMLYCFLLVVGKKKLGTGRGNWSFVYSNAATNSFVLDLSL